MLAVAVAGLALSLGAFVAGACCFLISSFFGVAPRCGAGGSALPGAFFTPFVFDGSFLMAFFVATDGCVVTSILLDASPTADAFVESTSTIRGAEWMSSSMLSGAPEAWLCWATCLPISFMKRLGRPP